MLDWSRGGKGDKKIYIVREVQTGSGLLHEVEDGGGDKEVFLIMISLLTIFIQLSYQGRGEEPKSVFCWSIQFGRSSPFHPKCNGPFLCYT